MNLYVVLGSAIVGLLVGMTGAGGGALMTPMLILLFNVKASTAISSDLGLGRWCRGDGDPGRSPLDAGPPESYRH